MKAKLVVPYIPLLLILLVGLIWRVIHFEQTFVFAHDQDLYSWIAKDILVNHHMRLVGQLTSVDGVFIGSFYYYLVAIFYWIFKMNPLSVGLPLTLIGLFNIWSFYFVVGRHFGRRAGLLAAFLYSASYGAALYDRWSVPTQPTITWCIWFLWVIFEFYKGSWKYVALYGFLVGFIWQIHIALLPVTILPIMAYFIGGDLKKRIAGISYKMVIVGIMVFLVSSGPFWLFEVKHNFSQTRAMVTGAQKDWGGPSGRQKVDKVLDASGREVQIRLLNGTELLPHEFFWILWLGVCVIVVKYGVIAIRKLALINGWILLIMLAQFWSKRVVSEYYFTNLVPVIIILISALLAKYSNRFLVIFFVFGYLCLNWKFLDDQKYLDDSYLFRKEMVEWVRTDARSNNYPCVAINYVTSFGKGVGFRYLFWYYGVKLVKPGVANVPTYNVFIPKEVMGPDENGVVFGRFGIAKAALPEKIISRRECELSLNQLDPLLGYTE